MKDNVQRDPKLTRPEITRLARRAGAVRLSGLVYEEINGIAEHYISKVVNAALQFTNKTLLPKHILPVLPEGIYPLEMQVSPCKLSAVSKVGRSKKGLKAIKEIRAYQTTTCLLSKETFWRFELEKLGVTDKDVIHIIHVAGEMFIINLFRATMFTVLNSNRKTLMPKDLQVTRMLSGALSEISTDETQVNNIKAAHGLPKFDYRSAIKLVLNDVNPGTKINTDALGQINFFINSLAENIAARVAITLTMEQETTIHRSYIVNAAKSLLGMNMNRQAQMQATNQSSKLSVDSAELFLRNCKDYTNMLGCSAVTLEPGAAQTLVNILEYVCAELLSSAADVAGNKTINARDLHLSILDDDEMSSLFRNLGIAVIGGGVQPHIHQRLLTKQQSQQSQQGQQRQQ